MSDFIDLTTVDGIEMAVSVDNISHIHGTGGKVYMNSGAVIMVSVNEMFRLGQYIDFALVEKPEDEES